MIELRINGRSHVIEIEPDTPLLWVLRDTLDLVGTKYGCGIAQCGACTVLVDGVATRSCSVPVEAVAGQEILTIEGVLDDPVGRRVVAAWVAQDVPQCGYCQSGQVMAVTALLKQVPPPTPAEARGALTNLCRCGSYADIAAAAARAASA